MGDLMRSIYDMVINGMMAIGDIVTWLIAPVSINLWIFDITLDVSPLGFIGASGLILMFAIWLFK